MNSLLSNCKDLYFHYNNYSFDVDKRSELFVIFKDIFQEVVLSLHTMKATEMIRYINYWILRDNDDLFDYLKKKVLKNELKVKKITNSNVDEVIEIAINLLQSDKSINYSVLMIEQLKQFYNLQVNQVSIWNESFKIYLEKEDEISPGNFIKLIFNFRGFSTPSWTPRDRREV